MNIGSQNKQLFDGKTFYADKKQTLDWLHPLVDWLNPQADWRTAGG